MIWGVYIAAMTNNMHKKVFAMASCGMVRIFRYSMDIQIQGMTQKAWFGAAFHGTVWYGMDIQIQGMTQKAWFGAAFHGTVWYGMNIQIQYGYSDPRHDTKSLVWRGISWSGSSDELLVWRMVNAPVFVKNFDRAICVATMPSEVNTKHSWTSHSESSCAFSCLLPYYT